MKKQDYADYGNYTVREDTDHEDYVFWAGGTVDDKGEEMLERNESLTFDPRCFPVGTYIKIFVPVDDEGLADWPDFRG